MKLVKLSVFALTMGLFLASCGGGGETPKADTAVVVPATPTPTEAPAATPAATPADSAAKAAEMQKAANDQKPAEEKKMEEKKMEKK